MMELYRYPIHHLHQMLAKKEISSKEITASVFSRIDEVEPEINAFISLWRDSAMDQAQEADRVISRGDNGTFTGIPVAIKDIIALKGVLTTCGSRILSNYRSTYDATVIDQLRKQGAVFVGKTNMDEFAMGSSNENSHFGPTKNPWNLDYVPGGSSGGSAAATSARECIASLGSDTGGSIRQPASHCGVVGLKPTYGRVSRYGLIAFASSLDQIGPITLDVRDCALLLQTIAGHDPRDSTSMVRKVPDYEASLGMGIKGLRVGIPKEYLGEGLDPEVRETFNRALKDLESLGSELMEVSIPHTEYVVAAYYIIASAEASSNLARYDGVRYGFRFKESEDLREMYSRTRKEGFGPEVIRRIMLGTYALSAGYYEAYYKKASQIRALLIKDFQEVFEICDFLLTPVAPTPAFKLREKIEDPLTMYLSDIFTISANLAGIPAISIPYGMNRKGLPIGIQLKGNYFDEETILKVAYALEQEKRVWHGRQPKLPWTTGGLQNSN